MLNCLGLSWWNNLYLGNDVFQWLGLVGMLLGILIVGKVFSYVMQAQSKRLIARSGKSTILGLMLNCLSKPGALLVFAGGLWLAAVSLNLSSPGHTDPIEFWEHTCSTIAILSGGWFIYRLIDVIEHFLLSWTSRTSTTLDDQLVPLIRKTLRIFVVIVGGLFIAKNVFDWDIAALLAGLGIGGLAFALAAKDMLANLFGSVTIFADRPFQMGDRIRVQGHDGEVVEVGFRSTKIRTLVGHVVTLPNALVANEAVENVSKRVSIKKSFQVTVTYDTSMEKMNRAIEILKEMLSARSENFPYDCKPRVHFTDFNAASLGISVVFWYAPPEWEEFLQFCHELNMELLERFNDAGIEFAFPTQTLYVHKGGSDQGYSI